MQALRRRLPIAFLAVALAGCGAAPTQEQVEQDVDQAVQRQVPAAPAEWGAAAEADTVQAGWIESFNDPALTALVIEAQSNNRDLATAAANVDRAWALARQAGAALSPDVSLTAAGARTGGADGSRPSTTNLSLGAQVSWEADVWGRLRSGQRGAVASAQAAEADFRSAQQSLAAATAKAYFSAIEANVQTGIARETVEILEETKRIVDVKHANGLVSAQDVSLARSDLATARERLTTVEGSYRDALRALEALMGRYPGAELEVRESLPEVPPPPPAGLPSELLERRPDIVAEKSSVQRHQRIADIVRIYGCVLRVCDRVFERPVGYDKPPPTVNSCRCLIIRAAFIDIATLAAVLTDCRLVEKPIVGNIDRTGLVVVKTDHDLRRVAVGIELVDGDYPNTRRQQHCRRDRQGDPACSGERAAGMVIAQEVLTFGADHHLPHESTRSPLLGQTRQELPGGSEFVQFERQFGVGCDGLLNGGLLLVGHFTVNVGRQQLSYVVSVFTHNRPTGLSTCPLTSLWLYAGGF